VYRVAPGQAPQVAATIQSLSAEDVYLDASSYLPLFLDFNTHPDDDLGRNIPVDIAFGAYQHIGGVTVPTRLQKFLNGTLLLDLSISSAKVNSGLPASNFAVTVTASELYEQTTPWSPPYSRRGIRGGRGGAQ
jgi:hypothetical protein